MGEEIKPYRVQVAEETLQDLRERLYPDIRH